MPVLLQNISELFKDHPDLMQHFCHYVKSVAATTTGVPDNSPLDIDALTNSIGNFVLREYDEYPADEGSHFPKKTYF